MIKEEKAPYLNHVAASDLELGEASFPIDDHASKKPQTEHPLRPNRRLLSLWHGNPADDDLHILVKAPVDPTQLLSHNSFIGDEQNQMFTVKIPKTDNVSLLKDEVSFPIDDLASKQLPTLGPSLRPHKLLSDLFNSGLDVSHFHIVARVPPTGPHSSFPPSAYRDPIRPPEQLAQDRQRFCNQRKPDAPSNGGNPQKFHDAQQKDIHIPCNRPSGFSTTCHQPCFIPSLEISSMTPRTPYQQQMTFYFFTRLWRSWEYIRRGTQTKGDRFEVIS